MALLETHLAATVRRSFWRVEAAPLQRNRARVRERLKKGPPHLRWKHSMPKRVVGWSRSPNPPPPRNGQTALRPLQAGNPSLQPFPLAGYDISCSRRVPATHRCRVAFESNHYTVPFEHAGALLELRVEPDRIVIYRGQKLIAQHPRSYARNQDIENPDPLSRLLQERNSTSQCRGPGCDVPV